MELDFSKIKDLKQAPKERKQAGHDKSYLEHLEALESNRGPNTVTPALQKEADRKKAQLEASQKVLKDYQRNKRQTGNLLAEINKGMLEGADIYSLFLKAIEALSLTVNEPALYNRCADNLTSIYGIGLQNEVPLTMKLESAQKRLESLTRALKSTNDTREQACLTNAVEAHRELIASIEKDVITN